MQIGDPYPFTPTAFEGEAEAKQDKKSKQKPYIKPRKLTGRVIFIHPAGRYFTVEARCGLGYIRESFLLAGEERGRDGRSGA